MSTAKFIVQVCRGLIREPRARRVTMFYSVLIALVLLFAGATLLDGKLRAHPVAFLLYWAACAWVTVLAVLLAIFDLLLVRAAARRERRRMQGEHFPMEESEEPHDPNPR